MFHNIAMFQVNMKEHNLTDSMSIGNCNVAITKDKLCSHCMEYTVYNGETYKIHSLTNKEAVDWECVRMRRPLQPLLLTWFMWDNCERNYTFRCSRDEINCIIRWPAWNVWKFSGQRASYSERIHYIILHILHWCNEIPKLRNMTKNPKGVYVNI